MAAGRSKWSAGGARNLLRYSFQQLRWRRLGAFGWRSHIERPRRIVNPQRVMVGERVVIRRGIRLEAISRRGGDGTIVIGPRVLMEDGVHIGAATRLEIGSDSAIGMHVTIIDHDHGVPNGVDSVLLQPLQISAVRIGRGVWVGDKATILKGVSIGDGAVIGAGAVVTKDVPAGGIAVGVPARTIRVNELLGDGREHGAAAGSSTA